MNSPIISDVASSLIINTLAQSPSFLAQRLRPESFAELAFRQATLPTAHNRLVKSLKSRLTFAPSVTFACLSGRVVHFPSAMMDSPLYPPTLSEMEEPDWLDLAANASAENQFPVDSCNAPSSLAPPPPPPVASLITTVKPASHSSTSIQEKPWKHEGYQAYCKLLASESDLFIARRFKSLNVRVALRMQDEVSRLEEQLLHVEKESREHKDVDNGTFRQDMVAERSQLLDQISTSLYRYSECRSLERPSL